MSTRQKRCIFSASAKRAIMMMLRIDCFRVMLLSKRAFLILCFFTAAVATAALFPEFTFVQTFSAVRYPEQTLILDAGHGGEDGGAVAVSGTAESGINLSIVLKLDQLCGLFGIHTKLLRDSDCSLSDESALTLREKKRSDLLNRVETVSQTENAVLLSIHQNIYSDSSSHGAQVFFHDDPESAAWGEHTQSLLVHTLDPSNTRSSKTISKDVYLMNHIACRALLVECGFLSNPAEDQLLESDLYQQQLAAVLAASYITFTP